MNKLSFASMVLGLVVFAVPFGLRAEWNNEKGDAPDYLSIKFDDPKIWSEGYMPEFGKTVQYALLTRKYNTPAVFKLDGDFSWLAYYIAFKVNYENKSLGFDGNGYAFALPAIPSDPAYDGKVYSNQPVQFKYRTQNIPGREAADYPIAYLLSGDTRAAQFAWTDAVWTLTSDAAQMPTLTFAQGNYNFYDPDGAAHSHVLYLDYTDASAAYLDPKRIVLKPGVSFNVFQLNIGRAEGVNDTVVFDGATLRAHDRFYANGGLVSITNGSAVTVDVNFNAYGGQIDVRRSTFSVSNKVSQTAGAFVLDDDSDLFVADSWSRRPGAGVLRIRNSRATLNNLYLNRNDGVVETGSSTTEFLEGAVVTNRGFLMATSDATFRMTDGAVLHNVGDMTFAADTKVAITGGARLTGEAALATTGASFELSGGATVETASANLGAATNLLTGAGTKLTTTEKMTVNSSGAVVSNGASVVCTGFTFNGPGANLTIADGASVTSLLTSAVSLTGTSAGAQVLTVNDANFFTKEQFDIANASAQNAVFEQNGENAHTFVHNLGNGNCVCVGQYGGCGVLRVNGGLFETGRIRAGRDAREGNGGSSLVEVNGGCLSVPYSFIFHQATAGDYKGGGTHEIRLNGGVFETATVTCGISKPNPSCICGDGGTMRATVDTADWVNDKVGKVACGDGGLTVDTAGHNVTMKCDLESKADEEGVLVKTGAGALTVTPQGGTWTLARARVEAGTLCFGADLVEPVTATDLTLAEGTTLSLVGAAKTLTVGDFTATNVVLALDPGDIIQVTGKLSIKDLSIKWSSVPSEESSFLRVAGELDDATRLVIRKMYYDNVLADGTHAEFAVAYDGGSGTSSVVTKVADDAPLAESAVWTGSGAWATAANWENAVKPDARKIAAFGEAGAGKTVEVAANDEAGALAFSDDGYRLAGEGPLLLTGYPGSAAIDVTEGAHAIDASVELYSQTPITLAAGTELGINGKVVDGGLAKKGTGRLVLGGELALRQGFQNDEAMTTVTNAAALGTSSGRMATHRSGTLEFRHPDGEEMRIAASVRSAGAESGTVLQYKTDTDVVFGDFNTTSGYFFKRGAGRMTVEVPADTTITLSRSGSGRNTGDIEIGAACTFPADGTEPPATAIAMPFSVVEGDLRFVGLGENAKVSNLGGSVVGLPVSERLAVQPSLTLDNVHFDMTGGGWLYNGYCAGKFGLMRQTNSVIRAVNGAKVTITGTQPGYSCTQLGDLAAYAFTNSTYEVLAANTYLSRGRMDAAVYDYVIVRYLFNGAKFLTKTSALNGGSVLIDLDNGSFMGDLDGTSPIAFNWDGSPARVYGEICVRNGSTLAVSAFNDVAGQTRDLTVAFDDGEWKWANDYGDYTIRVPNADRLKYEVRGRGLVLKPAAGKTVTVEATLAGAGGVVNAGKGTVRFAQGACAFSGVCEAADPDAVIDLTDAGALPAVGAAGAGTIVGMNASRITVRCPADDDWTVRALPTLDGCSAGTVVIDMGRTAENPMSDEFPTNLAVARWTGTGTVPNFKLAHTGLRNVGGTFRVDADGTVRMDVSNVGILLIVR